ncbi:MAG: UDP-N-acetylmuramate--alanine ligase [Burkholderiales bacterium]
MAKDSNLQRAQMRDRIAQRAAQLIAEHGIQDYALAKRKAARQLGAPATHSLPANSEIDAALRAHLSLFQQHEHAALLVRLRQYALQAMLLLEQFDPHLTGAVLNGTATEHAAIHLQLFVDSAKDVELFLLNRHIPYRAGSQRYRFGDAPRDIPTLIMENKDTEIEVALFAKDDLRITLKNPFDGKALARAKISQVRELLTVGGSGA